MSKLKSGEKGFYAKCWCGAKRGWFSVSYLRGCGGQGIRYCLCGGDLCVCHNHGEIECDGCAECEDIGEKYEDCDL